MSDVMELNLGPQHPSTHGVLRLKLALDGEVILSAEPIIGYLHTGIEKECESKTYLQVFSLVDRIDYLSGPSEEQGFAGAVEKLMHLEVPQRAQVIRVILLELSRIASHLIWAGTSALELNMSSVYMYCFAEREKILDIFESYSGARMFPGVWRVGGMSQDLEEGFVERVQSFCKSFPETWRDIDRLLTNNYVWCERLTGVAVIDRETALQYLCTGPVIRGAGVSYDMRKIEPYLGYEEYQFDIPIQSAGDAYARYLVRMEEMRQSLSIVEQALQKLKPGAVMVDDRKVALPPKEELYQSMEALIHHFKLICEGICPPLGKVTYAVESARGELRFLVVSDGSNKPYRVRVRSPSFPHVQVLKKILKGLMISDVVVAIASVDPILGDVDR